MKRIILSYIFFLAVVSAQVDTTIVYLGSIDSSIVMDVKYATTNNFVGKVLYPTDKVYMRKIVAEKLSEANRYLRESYNLSIKIFDGYRPLSVQKLMWEILPDPRYVADPSKGSRHNRGAAVDITLIDENGNQIEMGTPYGDFTEKAHYDYEELSDDVKANRKLLRDVMIKFGFEPLETEWWHFDFKGWEKFSILDYQIN